MLQSIWVIFISVGICKLSWKCVSLLQKSNNYVNLTIVIGNESCDLDSAVSALVYATFLHWQHQKMKCNVCTRNKRDESTYKDDIFVCLLDVDRQELPLKTEVAFCFKECGIKDIFLVFR